ncbi:Platinum sensitivity protein [Rhizoclosmatium sp. JEL0117]|nr:Platinum sensitivity protein [Rhizoclosmatium sp. JEL0117]
MNLRRVKVYQLDSDGAWEDKGTGSVAVSPALCIEVAYETPPETVEGSDPPLLLKTRIRKDLDFIRQQDTLIVWTEDDGSDMALSFQEQEGCNTLWNTIRQAKNRLNGVEGGTDIDIDNLPFTNNDDEDLKEDDRRSENGINLPVPSMSTIKEIEEIMFAASKGAYGRGQLSRAIQQDNFIDKLVPLLEMCEDLESLEELYSLSHIVKMIVFLNDSKVYDYILKDEIFPFIVGTLEYDREYPAAKTSYRQQTSAAKFKQLLPIPDAAIALKITQTYRIQFLRDTALARMLDDGTYAAMNSMVFFNQVDIVGWFVNAGPGEDYLAKVIGILNEEDIGEEGLSVQRDDVVLFLHELSTVAKGMQLTLRASYYRTMAKLGLFAIFDYTLVHEDIKVRLAAAAILASILDHDPALVRSFCMAQQKQQQPQLLINLLINRFHTDPDPGLQSQLCELIRVVLEADEPAGAVPATEQSELHDFLNLFYEKCIASLVAPIFTVTPESIKTLDGEPASIITHIVGLLSFAVKSHAYKSKYYILQSDMTSNLILLLRAKESYVKLAALRFFRTCFGMKDEFYNRHFLKHDIFSAILTCLKSTEGRYNLLNSACLDVFEFIRKENIKSLVSNLVQNHKSKFVDIEYVDTFKGLILRHEQNQETPVTSLGAEDDESSKPSSKPNANGWDNAEEAYFDESDDELDPEPASKPETTTAPSPRQQTGGKTVPHITTATLLARSGLPMKRSASPLGLVDYDDDDDEDDMFNIMAKRSASPISSVPSPTASKKLEEGSSNGGTNNGASTPGGGARISFTLNKGNSSTMKRRRSGSFSGEEEGGGSQMDTKG